MLLSLFIFRQSICCASFSLIILRHSIALIGLAYGPLRLHLHYIWVIKVLRSVIHPSIMPRTLSLLLIFYWYVLPSHIVVCAYDNYLDEFKNKGKAKYPRSKRIVFIDSLCTSYVIKGIYYEFLDKHVWSSHIWKTMLLFEKSGAHIM